jgi:hypothetical protein
MPMNAGDLSAVQITQKSKNVPQTKLAINLMEVYEVNKENY